MSKGVHSYDEPLIEGSFNPLTPCFMEKFFPLFVVRQIELLESEVQRIGRILLSTAR